MASRPVWSNCEHSSVSSTKKRSARKQYTSETDNLPRNEEISKATIQLVPKTCNTEGLLEWLDWRNCKEANKGILWGEHKQSTSVSESCCQLVNKRLEIEMPNCIKKETRVSVYYEQMRVNEVRMWGLVAAGLWTKGVNRNQTWARERSK